MTGFKLRTSGVGNDSSTNWATTTACPNVSFVPDDTKYIICSDDKRGYNPLKVLAGVGCITHALLDADVHH